MKNTLSRLLIIVVSLALASCAAHKRIVYLPKSGDITEQELVKNAMVFEARIMPKDVLVISVNTTTPEVALPFNLGSAAGSGINAVSSANMANVPMQTYVVDNSGNIEYPVVGTLHVAGLTRVELQNTIRTAIWPRYITEEPIVNVRFQNYKVSVLGEVARPGTFTMQTEQCTLFDALAQAGDLTIYGNRNNLLLIREDAAGTKKLTRIDLQSNNIITDPYIYYLQQNDVLYVEPNRAKARQSTIGSADTFLLSLVSTLISITTLIVTISR